MTQTTDRYDQALVMIKQAIDDLAHANTDAALSFFDEVRRHLNKREIEIREESGKYDYDGF